MALPTALLSEEEKARLLYFLGYVVTDPVSSIQLGIPRASQPMFLVMSQMNRIPEPAVGIVRRHMAILEEIENKLIDALDRFQAKSLGEIELRDDETTMLEREFARWAKRLADVLGVPLNQFSERFRAGGGVPISVSVSN